MLTDLKYFYVSREFDLTDNIYYSGLKYFYIDTIKCKHFDRNPSLTLIAPKYNFFLKAKSPGSRTQKLFFYLPPSPPRYLGALVDYLSS